MHPQLRYIDYIIRIQFSLETFGNSVAERLIVENVYNEFKRHDISVPFNQLEVRERKDNVKMPVIGKGLPERVEKVREESTDIDLETASLSEIINMRKKTKNKKSKSKK